MSEPTTAEMIAWCEKFADVQEKVNAMPMKVKIDQRLADTYAERVAMLRAIAARLRQASGKAEPAPTYDAQPPGLTVLAPKRPVE